jgi:hypothetical protein
VGRRLLPPGLSERLATRSAGSSRSSNAGASRGGPGRPEQAESRSDPGDFHGGEAQFRIAFAFAVGGGLSWRVYRSRSYEVERLARDGGVHRRRLDEAELVLLLVTPSFVASEFCYREELPRALERSAAGQALVIPLRVRRTTLADLPLGQIQGLPAGDKWVTSYTNADEAWSAVSDDLAEIVEDLRAPS